MPTIAAATIHDPPTSPEALADDELLAIALAHPPRAETLETARQALARAGGLRQLLDHPHDAGIADRDATALAAARELGRRYIATSVELGDPVRDARDLVQYFTAKLRHERVEVFLALFLTTRHHVIACEEISRGTLDTTVVYEREVARRALLLDASAVVLAHHHPSGCTSPSAPDRKLTEDLVAALALVRCRVLDHLIIGEEAAFSFVEHGLL